MIYGFDTYKKSEILRGHLKMGTASNGTDTITVNSRYFERNGVPFIGVMGEMHFSRIKRSEWRSRLKLMKAGGVNIVATYIFWIYHEETEGNYDFTGDLDLRAFILEAKDVGLDVVIRIGPWAHGECRHGGFPDWLVEKGLRLRTNDQEYLVYATDWYRHIYNEVKGLFFKDGGNIIGIQFENELVNAPEHLLKLKEIALSIGFDAPIYTATGWNSKFGARVPVDEFIPVFGAYADAPWAKGTDRLPPSPHFCFDSRRNDRLVGNDVIGENLTDVDGWRLPYERYPFALCELGSGIQSTYPRRTVISDLDAYAMSLVKLGSGNNLIGYYMYAGGSNKIGKLSTFQETRATGSPNDYPVINYDFHTAITEYGEVTARYEMLKAIHSFVNDFGDILAPMEYVEAARPAHDPSDNTKLRYALRTDGKSGFIFVNNHQRYVKMKDITNVSFAALGVTTPEITVKEDASFFIPVNLDMAGIKLEYALAQPLRKTGSTYYFLQIDGVEPRFKFEGREEIASHEFEIDGRIKICVLPFEKAVKAVRNRPENQADGVQDRKEEHDGPEGAVRTVTVEKVRKMLDYPAKIKEEIIEELHVSDDAKLTVKPLCFGADGFACVYDRFDVAIVISGGKLVADKFYDRLPFRISEKCKLSNDTVVVMTEPKDGIFIDEVI